MIFLTHSLGLHDLFYCGGCLIFWRGCVIFCVESLRHSFVERLRDFYVERLRDFCVERLDDFLCGEVA